MKSTQTNQFLYQYQLKHQQSDISKAEEKWSTEFNKQDINWEKVYKNIYSATIDNELRNFQYKYINRIIPTNESLFKYKLKKSNLCDFCNMYIETTRHLFWECRYIQQFWNSVSNLLREVHLEININFEVITLGIHEYTVNMKTNVQNFILIFAKHFIFKSKYSEDIPTFQKFKHCLIKRINIEHHIAHNRDKLDIHDNKWRNILQHAEFNQRPPQE